MTTQVVWPIVRYGRGACYIVDIHLSQEGAARHCERLRGQWGGTWTESPDGTRWTHGRGDYFLEIKPHRTRL